MNKFYDILRSIFISPEFALILILINIKIFFPLLLIKLSIPIQKLLDSNWLILFSTYIPLILASQYLLKEILFPSKNSKLLMEWPLYTSLKIRCWLFVSYPIIGLLISIILFIFEEGIKSENLSFSLLITIIPSISGIISSYIANIELKEILIRNSNNGD